MPRPPTDHTPPYAPIYDLPDEYETDGPDGTRADLFKDISVVSWVAAALVLTFAIAAMLLLGAFHNG